MARPLLQCGAPGASLWTILDRLRELHHMFPQVDVKYDPDASAVTPIIVHVRPHLDLLFSGKGQRLHSISVRRLRDPNPPVMLRYNDTVISSTEEVLRRVVVNRIFGPTYSGDELRYPGLWFSFEDDSIAEGIQGPPVVDREQEVKRVFISQKGNDGRGEDALGEVKECAVMEGDVSRAIVKVSRSRLLPSIEAPNSCWLEFRFMTGSFSTSTGLPSPSTFD